MARCVREGKGLGRARLDPLSLGDCRSPQNVTMVIPLSRRFAEPLFILACPRSYSSVVCAMLGQHPQMYALPETHLFGDETMAEWLCRADGVSYQMAHGLLRAVAELVFGEQTEDSVRRSAGWLRRRSGFSTGLLFEELSWAVHPAVVIDKSPSIVHDAASLERVQRFFPEARFLHLVRHPGAYSESVLKYLDLLSRPAYRPRERGDAVGAVPKWLLNLASFRAELPNGGAANTQKQGELDPQTSWYVLNSNIVRFLATVPPSHWLRVRGEDILKEPLSSCSAIVEWLGCDTNSAAVNEMLYPERSPYAAFGPPGARLGNDILFLENPRLRSGARAQPSLEDPSKLRRGGPGLRLEVRDLAESFGYVCPP
jgi:hypothetical protein